MGGKKKGGGKKSGGKGKGKGKGGKGAVDEEDNSFPNFIKAYRKKCQEYECDFSKIIKKANEDFEEEQEPLKKLHMWEELGWPGVKAIVEALKAAA